MSIQGALAASLRRFDPSPGAILDLRFKGDRETGYRPFFKREGIIYPTARQVRQLLSAGGAGFARAQINGDWRAFAPDEPVIGDDGLEGWQSAENRNAKSGELTGENGWLTSGSTPLVGDTGYSVDGLRATRFTFPAASLLGFRVYDEQAAGWVAPIGGSVSQINTYAPGRVSFSFVAPAGCTAVRVYPVRGVGQENYFRYKVFAVTPGETYTARWLAAKSGDDYYIGCFEFRADKELNDPPIQTDALPATRTGTDYRIGGLYAEPTHYGVARVFWAAPLGASASAFPVAFEFASAGGVDDRTLWRRSGVNASFYVRIGGNNIFGVTTPAVAGTWETLAWRCKAGDYAASLNGEALSKNGNVLSLPPLTTLGLLGNSQNAGNGGNNKMSRFAIWNGDISDAELRALSARVSSA